MASGVIRTDPPSLAYCEWEPGTHCESDVQESPSEAAAGAWGIVVTF